MTRSTSFALVAAGLVLVAASLTVVVSFIGAEERPPCRACKQTKDDRPPTPICELTRDPNTYADRVLRVEGQFRNDAGQLFIEGGGCTMHVAFSKELQACSGALKKLQVTCGVKYLV